MPALRPLFILLVLIVPMALSDYAKDSSKTVMFFGDSLTAGYGVNYEASYPMALQSLLRENGLPWKVIPSGVSGETTAGGLRRVNWALRQPVDVFVLALGGNDGLRGIDLENTRSNLIETANRARAKYPDIRIVIAGMQMPPNLGERYATAFKELYPEVAEALDADLIPFLLEGVGGEPEYNQNDGIHPNEAGHRVIAKHLFNALRPILEE
jgi:acyl-CoA thioesterase-1